MYLLLKLPGASVRAALGAYEQSPQIGWEDIAMAGLSEGSVIGIVFLSAVLAALYALTFFLSGDLGVRLVALGLLTGLGAVLLGIFSQSGGAAVRATPGSVQVASGVPIVELLMKMAVLLVAGG